MAERVRIGRDGARTPVALFDLDNTLFDRAATYRRWAVDYVADAGLEPGEVEWLVEADRDGLAPREVVWAAARARYGLSETIDELVAAYRTDYVDHCVPDHAVLDALSTLRRAGWGIGIVTNGPVPQQADKAARLGLLALVDAFCASGELGVEKPDRRIFEEAVRRCAHAARGTDVQPLFMVGDAPVADIGGGRGVGLTTVWIHRDRPWLPSDGAGPDVTVDSPVAAIEAILRTAER